METLANKFSIQPFLLLDRDYLQSEGLNSFADTNALLRFCSQFNQPIIHFWTLADTVILGMMDTKLPQFQSAVEGIKHLGYHAFIRNSGGLAVVADTGILNISLFLPNARDLSIDNAYFMMYDWIRSAFATATIPIDHMEITHSYCPGDYDLSIHGRKFAGISQRRSRQGVAVMLYLSVTGNQQARGKMIRDFYQTGLENHQNGFDFPTVEPSSMADLSELNPAVSSINQVKHQLQMVFSQQGLQFDSHAGDQIVDEPEYLTYYMHAFDSLKQRNTEFFGGSL